MAELVLTWQLVNGQTRSYQVTDMRPVCIGRSADLCDVVIDEPMVSRRHASIYATGGMFYLRNESATNVVHLNNQYRLVQHQTMPLQPGESFRVGPISIQVSAQAAHLVRQVPKITCHRCGNICEYDPEEFCPHCGESLAGGQTVFISG